MTDRLRRTTIGIRFGTIITRLRTAKGWTRPVLAQQAGLSDAYVRLVEHGLSLPTLPVVIDLAAALDVPPSELVRQVVEETS